MVSCICGQSWGNIGMIVLPDQIAVPKAYEAFDADGQLKDLKLQASVEGLGVGLAEGSGQVGALMPRISVP